MGNCIKKESSTQWGGDDWGYLSPVASVDAAKTMMFPSTGIGHESNYKLYKKETKMEEKSSCAREKKGPCFPCPTTTTTTMGKEVKIKITKKQLEELLSKVDAQGQSMKQVLTQLLNFGDGYDQPHQRPWRPALQSIPETEMY
ncbi:hypothetical protein ACH5RR_027892 [Cinchona calisaya]|uniref:Uncharacterized protein n=1 Tax=Cinchona calisaya TaxID=153742 RepID=A0ABD2YM64_9GENT